MWCSVATARSPAGQLSRREMPPCRGWAAGPAVPPPPAGAAQTGEPLRHPPRGVAGGQQRVAAALPAGSGAEASAERGWPLLAPRAPAGTLPVPGVLPWAAALPRGREAWRARRRRQPAGASLGGRLFPPLARPVRAGVPPPGAGSTSRAGEEVSWCRLGCRRALLTCFSHKLVSMIWLTSSWKREVCRERRRPSRRPRAPWRGRGGYSPPSPAGTWTPRTG